MNGAIAPALPTLDCDAQENCFHPEHQGAPIPRPVVLDKCADIGDNIGRGIIKYLSEIHIPFIFVSLKDIYTRRKI